MVRPAVLRLTALFFLCLPLIAQQTEPNQLLINGCTMGARILVQQALAQGADPNSRNESGEPALLLAARKGNEEIVKALLDAGADVNGATEDGLTALMEAALNNRLGIVQTLINNGAEINAKTRFGGTALSYAAGTYESSGFAIVRALVEAGADVNGKAEDDYPPLLAAAYRGDHKTVQLLIKEGADVNWKPEEATPALMEASLQGHFEVVSELLKGGANVNQLDVYGRTALDRSQARGHENITQALLNAGGEKGEGRTAPPDSDLLKAAALGDHQAVTEMLANEGKTLLETKNEDGHTPLSRAVRGDHIETVLVLLAAGADPNTLNKYGRPLLGTAAIVASKKTFDALLQAGAKVNLRPENGITPLITAVQSLDPLAVQFLLEAGADVLATDEFGFGILHFWSDYSMGDETVLDLLLRNGADIEAKDLSGTTPLVRVVKTSQHRKIGLLLKAGADPNNSGPTGIVPLSGAIVSGDIEGVRLLLGAGANPTLRDENGFTPSLYALQFGHEEITKLLESAMEAGGGASKQSELEPDLQRDIRRLMNAVMGGDEELLESMKQDVVQRTRMEVNRRAPGSLPKNFEKFMEKTTQEIFERDLDELTSPMISLYAEHYTHEEIKELIQFYESPLGQKVRRVTQESLPEESARFLQWSHSVDLEIEKELAEEFPELQGGGMTSGSASTAGLDQGELNGRDYTNQSVGVQLTLPTGWQLNSQLRDQTGAIAAFTSPLGDAAATIIREPWKESVDRYQQAVEFNLKKSFSQYEKLATRELVTGAGQGRQLLVKVTTADGRVTLKFLIGILPGGGEMTRITFWGVEQVFDRIQDQIREAMASYAKLAD